MRGRRMTLRKIDLNGTWEAELLGKQGIDHSTATPQWGVLVVAEQYSHSGKFICFMSLSGIIIYHYSQCSNQALWPGC